LKNTKGKKNITERKSTWKITKELRHPPIVTGKYITYFFNNFMGNHGELVEKIFLHPYDAGGLHIILLR
jgi:hypothetical protein